jgi:predicted acylesterase/phospholipase RssA
MRNRSRLIRCILVVLSLALLYPARSATQITFGDDTLGARPLGLSISGGISLGSYQAGVNYGLLEVYRHAAWNGSIDSIPKYRLRTVTGASAGNINTLLWAVEACTNVHTPGQPYVSPLPEHSLFWQVWLDIGWDALMKEKSPELALFDRTALIQGVVGHYLKPRLSDPRLVDGCRVPAGITLTRIRPDTLYLQGLAIETQRHVTPFTVQVDSRGSVDTTRVRFVHEERIGPEDQYFGVLVRLQPHDRDIPFLTLLEAVKASASFPVTFAPVELNVWYPSTPRRESRHGPQMFADGGVFDNNPVGFARNLYGLDGDTAKLDILYVNPYRLRGELDTLRTDAGKPVPSGGLAAVMALLQGAVPTARQYELQLLARERAHQQEVAALEFQLQSLTGLSPAAQRAQRMSMQGEAAAPPPAARERLLLSSRGYPVLGEHLGSFAAFLARPGREFDFYVGMYDAFYMALAEHACPAANASRAARDAQHRCVGQRLPALITDTALVRAPARQVLARLYGREYGDGIVSVPAVQGKTMADRVTVQDAFFDALGTQFELPDTARCGDKRLVFSLLCRDGLWWVLESIGNNEAAVDVLDDWSDDCTQECTEREFYRLVANPMSGATAMLDDVIQRLRTVEVMMKTQPGVEGSDMVAPVTAGQWLFYATHLRSRPWWDPYPNSLPWRNRNPLSYIGANLGTVGLEARWQPTLNVGNPTFLRGNVIFHYNGQPIRSNEELYGGAGVMIGRYVNKVAISEWGVGVNVFHPLHWESGLRMPVEAELSGVFAANQLRLGLRVMPIKDQHGLLHGRRGWALSFGLNDPVGLIHWLISI